jgi:Retroviral aspartyl protease
MMIDNFSYHQCKLKVQILIAQEKILDIDPIVELDSLPNTEELMLAPEETIVSMHVITNNLKVHTMYFEGFIGQTPILALVDSSNTHNFVNLMVLKGQNYKIIYTHPTIVMVVNENRMVTYFKCESLYFSIQDNEFHGDLRLLPLRGYDVLYCGLIGYHNEVK